MSKPKRNIIHGELATSRQLLRCAIHELGASVDVITDVLEGVEEGDVRELFSELVTEFEDVERAINGFRQAYAKTLVK